MCKQTSVTIEEIRQLVAKFSDDTFGSERPYTAPLVFLEIEVCDLKKTGTIEDYADCLILLLDSFRKRYPEADAQQLIDFAKQKLEVIIPSRRWIKISPYDRG
jgi:hypothetical protein